MLTNADTVVMASLKGQKGSLDGSSARAEEAANARNAAAVKQQAITAMVPAGTSAAFGCMRSIPGERRFSPLQAAVALPGEPLELGDCGTARPIQLY